MRLGATSDLHLTTAKMGAASGSIRNPKIRLSDVFHKLYPSDDEVWRSPATRRLLFHVLAKRRENKNRGRMATRDLKVEVVRQVYNSEGIGRMLINPSL